MISLTEEIIVNPEFQRKWKGLRQFRIEYGFECSCPEGTIYLPDHLDPDIIEEMISYWLKDWKCTCHE